MCEDASFTIIVIYFLATDEQKMIWKFTLMAYKKDLSFPDWKLHQVSCESNPQL